MERKMIPLALMLVAGAICSIVCYAQHYDFVTMLLALFIVLLIFYILGCIIKRIMEAFEAENEARAKEEGEVIEKENDGENGENVSNEAEKK